MTLAGYFVYSLLLPTLFGLLASNPERFLDLQRRVYSNLRAGPGDEPC